MYCRVVGQQREGLDAIARLDDPVSLLDQAPNEDLPHRVLILDNENGR
jgi:hypothetical protein